MKSVSRLVSASRPGPCLLRSMLGIRPASHAMHIPMNRTPSMLSVLEGIVVVSSCYIAS